MPSEPPPSKRILRIRLNGRWREDAVADNTLLVDYLRETAGMTGTKVGCDGGECGACTVLVDDLPTPACVTLAVRCDRAVRGNHREPGAEAVACIGCSMPSTRSSARNAASAHLG